jgi:phage antirepressor YoqD-like protein
MGVGRNKLFEILRDKGIFDRHNIPYQTYIDRGYFRTIESTYNKPDGSSCINIKTVVFQKGLDFIRKLLNNISKKSHKSLACVDELRIF